MSTRGAVGFYKKGVDKITYNHFDSYPSGLGNVMKQFFSETSPAQIEDIFAKIVLVDNYTPVSKQDRIKYAQFSNKEVSSGEDWYSLLRETQGNFEAYRDTDLPFMIDNKNFMEDSLFCEWAYIYNLDKDVLEIYRGFQRSSQDNRYKIEKPSNEGYWHVALIKEVPYENIPDFDMDAFEKEIYGR